MRSLKQFIKERFKDVNLLLRKRDWRAKIHIRYAKNSALSKTRRDAHFNSQVRDFYRQYRIKVNPLWHQAYWQITGNKDVRYMPDDIFHLYLEPRLNRKDLCTSYIDKNIYDRLFPGVRMPRTVVRNMNGQYLDPSYKAIAIAAAEYLLTQAPGQYIVKPAIESMGGKNINLITIDADRTIILKDKAITFQDLDRVYGQDFIVQEKLDQNNFLSAIYSHSVNTIRITTLRYNGETHVLSSVLRLGNKGSFVDNFSAGGVCCGINQEGKLSSFAIDGMYNKYSEHPFTQYKFAANTLPNYDGIKAFAIELHNYLPPYFNMASWDIAVDNSDHLVMIEFNMRTQQIDFHQMHNGPIFGDFTEELLQHFYGGQKAKNIPASSSQRQVRL
jgi:hypothetical protein